ncbi:alpha-L-fucosidase [Carnobacterium gallinarum]|uniref:alpha-L-fucosidase n=1 Tax=Carnobacterium gallinarum TaxID=2749 RepID=UPI0005507AC1|nr:alpha-L-fucosidase [Carnobacterium gallinarum]
MVKIREDIEENLDSQQEAYGELSEGIQQKLEWFKDQKIGVIFHWGLYSEAGIVESWQLSEEDEWARKKGAWRGDIDQLRNDYWGLNQTFNPINFDPQHWAEKAKEAGFKYMLFTTKHHDGFNMYDTKFSEYKITAPTSKFHTNQQADILHYVNEAFRSVGINTGAYYSKADWHSPDYWVPDQRPKGRFASYDPKKNPEIWSRFDRFVENQLVEICENYGPLDILWLDGGWVNSSNHEFLDMDRIVEKLRTIQPDLLMVDRTIGGKYEDYVTPERKIPEIPPVKAWESNIPLAKNWGYVPNDLYKSFEEILESMIKIVSLGGNVILGVGPKPDGTLPEESLKLMKQLGDWLAIFGDGIYGTRPISTVSSEEWYATQKGNKIYVFYKTKDSEIKINLTQISKFIQRVVDLETGEDCVYLNESIQVPVGKHIFGGLVIELEETV